ncbi:MAG: hypothetical protein B5M53_06025 [Candidatus Cloacimonas sp. 4484_209]|nr:MAG: hypothetical protein B5M53_06025 [Candidatus Cloacimonas sp. 4484_209]
MVIEGGFVKKILFLVLMLLTPVIILSYDILPVDSLRAGMHGYGISVFSNNKPDTFGVEILGVIKKAGPGRKLIIARLSGAGLEKTGIIAGMSGSPVFVNEKIIGAVAYAWSYSLEPITGITPIEDIIATKTDTNAVEGGGADIKIEGKGLMSPYSGVSLRRIKTLLSISGFDNLLIGKVDNFLREKGFDTVIGGGASGEQDGMDSLFLGAAVAARLVGGDVSLGAIGTVSYIDGKDVFAFGHPLFYSGATSLPMTTAYVYAIMPNQVSSFKIASPEKEIGAVVADGKNAIYGIIGEKAKTIPVSVSVSKGKKKHNFHFTVVEQKDLTPFLTGVTYGNSILTEGRSFGSLTISLSMTLELQKYGKVEINNFFSGDKALTFSINAVQSIIDMFYKDRFEEININKINVNSEISDGERTAEIMDMKPTSFTVHRGIATDVKVFLKKTKGEEVVKKFSITIPVNYTDSIAKIAVVGADGYMRLENERAVNIYTPSRAGQIVDIIKHFPRNNVLYCLLLSSKPGIIIRGYEMSALPSSMLYLMGKSQSMGEGNFTKGDIIKEFNKECDFQISGGKVITLRVVD